MIITSLDNKKIKELAKLKQKKHRDLTNRFLVEGEHLIQEAAKSNLLEEIILIEDYDTDISMNKTYVSKEVMKKLTDLDTPCSMIGVCKKNNNDKIIGNKILLLDDIQDPGNLGTIIRSSVAFNVETIVLSKNTVDLYNPKVIRSTQGMLFHINIITMDLIEAIEKIHNKNILVYATDVVDGTDVRTLTKEEKNRYALVMGNEGNGVSDKVKHLCDKNLYIKMNEKTESLNVGIATSILLYELGD